MLSLQKQEKGEEEEEEKENHEGEVNKVGYTAQDACVIFTFENNTGRTDGPTNRRTNQRTDRHNLL